LGFLLAALMDAGLLLGAKPAHAADFTVTNTNDLGAVGESRNSEFFRLPNFR
jgi:hypothetical protein